MFFVIILNDRIRPAQRGSTAMRLAGEGASTTLYSLAAVLTDCGLLCLSFVLMFWETGFLSIYTALFVSNLAFLMLAFGGIGRCAATTAPSRPADSGGRSN
jgi:hypothetical protein